MTGIIELGQKLKPNKIPWASKQNKKQKQKIPGLTFNPPKIPRRISKPYKFPESITTKNRNISFEYPKKSLIKSSVGADFFPLFFVFSLTRYRVFFFFSLRYFVNYAPLLRAVCKFRYSLLSRLFITSFYVSISVTTFVEVDYPFPRWP